jgi:hypothetical protein
MHNTKMEKNISFLRSLASFLIFSSLRKKTLRRKNQTVCTATPSLPLSLSLSLSLSLLHPFSIDDHLSASVFFFPLLLLSFEFSISLTHSLSLISLSLSLFTLSLSLFSLCLSLSSRFLTLSFTFLLSLLSHTHSLPLLTLFFL